MTTVVNLKRTVYLLVLIQMLCGGFLFAHESYVLREYQIATDLQGQQNYIAATKLYIELFNTDKKNREVILEKLSRLYETRNMTHDYIAFLQNKIKLEPFDAILNTQLAAEYLSVGKSAESLERIQIVLESAVATDKTFKLASESYYRLKNYEQCIQLSSKIIENKRTSNILLLRAECYLHLQMYSLAESDFNNYIIENRPGQKFFNLQSQLYIKSDNQKKLENSYQLCLVEIPQSQECFAGYIKYFLNKNDKFCRDHFEKHQNQFDSNSYILSEMARLYESRGNIIAEELYAKALKTNPNSFVFVKALFNYYRKMKQPQKAYNVIDSYLKENPESKEAITAKQSMFVKGEISETAPAAAPEVVSVPDSIKTVEVHSPVNELNKEVSHEEKARLLYQSGKFQESLYALKKIAPRTDEVYFRVGNILVALNYLASARLNWSQIKRNSDWYYKAQINTVLAMRLENMKSTARKKINEDEFPEIYNEKITEIKRLFALYPRSRPKEEQTQIDLQFKNLMYLDWGL